MSRELQLMLDELESHRLEVQLVPLNPKLRGWCDGGMKRVVCDRNPKWYRSLCAAHLSSRKRNHRKPDTKIRRIRILQILRRLCAGKSSWSKYAPELRRTAERMAA